MEYERGKKLADEYKINFLETSAKKPINVDEAFISLAKDIKARLIDGQDGALQDGASGGGDGTIKGGDLGGGGGGSASPSGSKGCCK